MIFYPVITVQLYTASKTLLFPLHYCIQQNTVSTPTQMIFCSPFTFQCSAVVSCCACEPPLFQVCICRTGYICIAFLVIDMFSGILQFRTVYVLISAIITDLAQFDVLPTCLSVSLKKLCSLEISCTYLRTQKIFFWHCPNFGLKFKSFLLLVYSKMFNSFI